MMTESETGSELLRRLALTKALARVTEEVTKAD